MRYARTGLMLLLTACAALVGSTVEVTKLTKTTLEPRPATYPIRVYRTDKPRCEFDKIATLSTDVTPDLKTTDDLDNLLRVQARQLGGDALTDLASDVRTSGGDTDSGGNVRTYKTPFWTATVIRFKSPQCAE